MSRSSLFFQKMPPSGINISKKAASGISRLIYLKHMFRTDLFASSNVEKTASTTIFARFLVVGDDFRVDEVNASQ